MRVGSGNFWQWLRRAGNLGTAGDATDVASARTALGLGSLAVKNTVATADIDNDAVTYAKIQNISAASRLLGRGSAGGAGDTEELTAGAGLLISTTTLLSAFGAALFHTQHTATAGTNGGGQTSGSYATRTMNTSVTNEISGASLSGNQLTNLPAGTYWMEVEASFGACDLCKIKLRNITDGSDVIIGRSCDAPAGQDNSTATLAGRFTLAGTKTLAIQGRVGTTNSTTGWGTACNFGDTEIYMDSKLWKIA